MKRESAKKDGRPAAAADNGTLCCRFEIIIILWSAAPGGENGRLLRTGRDEKGLRLRAVVVASSSLRVVGRGEDRLLSHIEQQTRTLKIWVNK